MNDCPDHHDQTAPVFAPGARINSPWASPEPCQGVDPSSQRQTVLLLVPTDAPDRSFLQMLRAHLRLTFGTDVRLQVRTEPGCPGRCRYRLSGEWCRPADVHDALVTLFSVMHSETTDEHLLP